MGKIITFRTVIALGSNLGDKDTHLNEAIRQIRQRIGKIECVSDFYHSEPWGYTSENHFLNACLICQTRFHPEALLQELKNIERDMGRIKFSSEYADRIIDLDIILFENVTLKTTDLCIPHPHYLEREFVRKPLQQIIKKNDPFYAFLMG